MADGANTKVGVEENVAYLKPHSDEWFEAMYKLEPMEAIMVAQIIRWAGTRQVCSICGNFGARDYKIIGKFYSPLIGATLRLCDHCLEVRKDYGESFEKL